jgi:tetratricopeptide (TPR) repeat protein
MESDCRGLELSSNDRKSIELIFSSTLSSEEQDRFDGSARSKVELGLLCNGQTAYAHYKVYEMIAKKDLGQENNARVLKYCTRDDGKDGFGEALAVYVGRPNRNHVACYAVDECVRRMRVGERAEFLVGSGLGYGEEGSASFPSIAKNADLVVYIELLHVEGTEQEPDEERGDLTFEARMRRAELLKQKGNEDFLGNRKRAALCKYEAGLSYITEDLMQQLMKQEHILLAETLRATTRLNCANCYLGLGMFMECVRVSDLARSTGEGLTKLQECKALYRKAQALESLGRDEDALRAFTECLALVEREITSRADAQGQRGRNKEEEEEEEHNKLTSEHKLCQSQMNRLKRQISQREKNAYASFRGAFEKKEE